MYRQVERGFLAKLDITMPIIVYFQYNPQSLTDKMTASYNSNSKNGKDFSSFSKTSQRKISFQVIVDGRESSPSGIMPAKDSDGGITPELNKYREFLFSKSPVSELMSGVVTIPTALANPKTIFKFGHRIMECHVESVSVKETLFNSSLAPIRAEVDIFLVEERETNLGRIAHYLNRVPYGI